MLSANQLYKKSDTKLSFKQWLKDTQSQGVLDNHEEPMFNANGDEEILDNTEDTSTSDSGIVTLKLTTKKAKSKMGATNIIGILGLGLLIYGITRTSAE
jgi:hypothetical protein